MRGWDVPTGTIPQDGQGWLSRGDLPVLPEGFLAGVQQGLDTGNR